MRALRNLPASAQLFLASLPLIPFLWILGDVWTLPRIAGIGFALAAVVAGCVEAHRAPLEAGEASGLDVLDGVGGPEWVPALTVWEESK